jgi:hypothetical protein
MRAASADQDRGSGGNSGSSNVWDPSRFVMQSAGSQLLTAPADAAPILTRHSADMARPHSYAHSGPSKRDLGNRAQRLSDTHPLVRSVQSAAEALLNSSTLLHQSEASGGWQPMHAYSRTAPAATQRGSASMDMPRPHQQHTPWARVDCFPAAGDLLLGRYASGIKRRSGSPPQCLSPNAERRLSDGGPIALQRSLSAQFPQRPVDWLLDGAGCNGDELAAPFDDEVGKLAWNALPGTSVGLPELPDFSNDFVGHFSAGHNSQGQEVKLGASHGHSKSADVNLVCSAPASRPLCWRVASNRAIGTRQHICAGAPHVGHCVARVCVK